MRNPFIQQIYLAPPLPDFHINLSVSFLSATGPWFKKPGLKSHSLLKTAWYLVNRFFPPKEHSGIYEKSIPPLFDFISSRFCLRRCFGTTCNSQWICSAIHWEIWLWQQYVGSIQWMEWWTDCGHYSQCRRNQFTANSTGLFYWNLGYQYTVNCFSALFEYTWYEEYCLLHRRTFVGPPGQNRVSGKYRVLQTFCQPVSTRLEWGWLRQSK